MDKKELKETQELNEEQLEGVSGGARILSACSRMTEANDGVFIGILESAAPEEGNDEHGWDPGLLASAKEEEEGNDGHGWIWGPLS